jgi:predicted NBD/HSP70 family sugar kinase
MTTMAARDVQGEAAQQVHERTLFEHLLANDSLTRDDIAELTGRSRIAVANDLDALVGRGLVHRVPLHVSGLGGPASRRYALTRTSSVVVGADISHDKVTVAAADVTGTIRAQLTEPLNEADDVADVLETVIRRCLDRAGTTVEQLSRVVVGSPGVIDPISGEFAFAYLLPNWKQTLTADLRRRLGELPVVFENDVNLAAMAEARNGAGRGVDNMVFAWMHMGVGLGAVLNGRLHRGRHGWAGEIGFMEARLPTGHLPDPRRPSAIHEFVQVSAIESLAMRHGFPGNAPVALLAAGSAGERGDTFLNEVAARVAMVVAPTCLVLNPSLVVLGGSYVHAGGSDFVRRVQRAVEGLCPVPSRIALAEVAEHPVLRGALQTALDDARDGLFPKA